MKDILTNANFLGFLVVIAGVVLSFKQPAAGHDVIIGGVALIGGAGVFQKKEKEQA